MKVNRDLLFDSLRGIAIIAVIATHSIYLGGSPDSPGFLYYRQLLNFAAPAFFFMSGYWASKKQIESFKDYKGFLKRRFFRIGTPYLFWSLILLSYSAIKKADFDGFEIAFKLLTGGACIGYYFIIAISQLYIMTPLLQYINKRLKWYGFAFVFVFNLAILFILYLSRSFTATSIRTIFVPFYSWIIYYETGLFIGVYYKNISVSPRIRTGILLAILGSWLASNFEASILLSKYGRPLFAASVVKYSSFVYSALVILGFLFWKDYFRHFSRLLSSIGHYSLGIYLIHAIILGRFAVVFQKVDFISSFQPVYQLILVAATTAASLVFIIAARKLLPESFCVRVLGF